MVGVDVHVGASGVLQDHGFQHVGYVFGFVAGFSRTSSSSFSLIRVMGS